jgi:hypothetical protein
LKSERLAADLAACPEGIAVVARRDSTIGVWRWLTSYKARSKSDIVEMSHQIS